MNTPLSHIRLLDLTHMLSGPYAGMILADLGCDTVKVEPPGTGEGTRRLLEDDPNNSIKGMGAYFFTLNRNMRSVAIDLKSDEGRKYFFELVKVADVVLDNFAAGVTSRLGIDHKALTAINPGIVSCTVSGFGESGPSFKRPAFDQIVQGLGGGMSITGSGTEDAVRAGIPIGDLAGGMFAVMGIQAALLSKAQTGEGQHIDISMLDCQISLLNYMATMYSMSGDIPTPIGNSHFVHTPYNTFNTADDQIIIAVIGDKFWPAVVELLGIEELDTPKYATAKARLAEKSFIEGRIGDALIKETADHWLMELEKARIPCARVNNLAQALSDPQVQFRNMVVALEHPEGGTANVPGNPIKFSETNDENFTSPPLLGVHTKEVFREWTDMTNEQITAGIQAGFIAGGD